MTFRSIKKVNRLDKDLFRNGSGYADFTAYIAMNNVQKELRKAEKKMEFMRGEIYEYEMPNECKTALVVSADYRAADRYLNVILLNSEPKGDTSVAITTQSGIMYADCGMVSYAVSSRLRNYMRIATSKEMEQIDAGICKCLGIESKVIEKEVVKEVIKEVPMEVSVPVEQNDMSAELVSAKKEAEIYKTLYEQLLAKVMG